MQAVKACVECGGKGQTIVDHVVIKQWTQPIVVYCLACKGRGRVISKEMITDDILFG